ncbi:MAG: hypothetical protein WBK91_00585 [Alphaproteobacteria bacterium]
MARRPQKILPPKRAGDGSPGAVSPFDFAATATEISGREEAGLIPELLETIARCRNRDTTGSKHWVDTELINATAQVVSAMAQKEKLVESPVAAAISVAAYNFDLTPTRTETVLATLLHRFCNNPGAAKEKVFARLKQIHKNGPRRGVEVLVEIDRKRTAALDVALAIAREAAKITISPRDFAVQKGAAAEDFINLREAILSFRPEVSIVKIGDAASGLKRIDRAPQAEQEARLQLIEQAYIPLADALGWTRMSNPMRDMVLTKRSPFLVKELTDQVERLPGFKGLYSDPKVHKELTIDMPREVKRALMQYLPLNAGQVLVSARRKSLYGVARKKQDKGYKSLDQVWDILALRVVIPDGKNTEEDHRACLKVMGAFKKIGFKAIPGEYNDYISNTAKPYQSLHNAFTHQGMRLEVQVRTERMHWEAELKPGVSHIDYAAGSKSKSGNVATLSDSYLARVEQVRAEIGARLQGRRSLLPLRAENVFCFDEQGRWTKLPNIGPSLMDALINMHRQPKGGITAADAVHASQVYLNGKQLQMDSPSARSIEIENGDALRVDPTDIDRFRPFETRWKVATQYARGILVQEIRAQRARSLGAARPGSATPGTPGWKDPS